MQVNCNVIQRLPERVPAGINKRLLVTPCNSSTSVFVWIPLQCHSKVCRISTMLPTDCGRVSRVNFCYNPAVFKSVFVTSMHPCPQLGPGVYWRAVIAHSLCCPCRVTMNRSPGDSGCSLPCWSVTPVMTFRPPSPTTFWTLDLAAVLPEGNSWLAWLDNSCRHRLLPIICCCTKEVQNVSQQIKVLHIEILMCMAGWNERNEWMDLDCCSTTACHFVSVLDGGVHSRCCLFVVRCDYTSLEITQWVSRDLVFFPPPTCTNLNFTSLPSALDSSILSLHFCT